RSLLALRSSLLARRPSPLTHALERLADVHEDEQRGGHEEPADQEEEGVVAREGAAAQHARDEEARADREQVADRPAGGEHPPAPPRGADLGEDVHPGDALRAQAERERQVAEEEERQERARR